MGIFRQGSLDNTYTLSVPGLDKSKQYLVKLAPTNSVVAKMSGKELEKNGFKVRMNQLYDSKLFEIEIVK